MKELCFETFFYSVETFKASKPTSKWMEATNDTHLISLRCKNNLRDIHTVPISRFKREKMKSFAHAITDFHLEPEFNITQHKVRKKRSTNTAGVNTLLEVVHVELNHTSHRQATHTRAGRVAADSRRTYDSLPHETEKSLSKREHQRNLDHVRTLFFFSPS